MRVALGVEYDGSGFSGWEAQRGADTVQARVETALSRVADHPVRTVCAGRTDAGVHAICQVIHFDTGARREPRGWVFGGNTGLPRGVSLLWAQEVPEEFHARFSARSRHYRYLILNRAVRPGLAGRRVAWACRRLDLDLMRAAAEPLVGEHDFSSFRAAACQARSPIRRLHRLDVERTGDLIVIDVVANAFLQHMVRNIAGVLLAVGAGRHPPSWVEELIAARDREAGGVTAPACGLYLVGVHYPPQWDLPRVPAPAALW